jgi:hypothetical protein
MTAPARHHSLPAWASPFASVYGGDLPSEGLRASLPAVLDPLALTPGTRLTPMRLALDFPV